MENRILDYKNVTLDETFSEFVQSKNGHTKYCYGTYLKQWVLFSELNGKESLELKKNDKDAITEKKVVQFKEWLQSKGIAETSSQTAIGALRGFFSFHRMPLVFINAEKKALSEGNRKTEDYLFAKEDFVKMDAQGNLTEKYVVLVGKSLGLRVGDFLNVTYGKLRSLNLDAESPIFIGETVTQKEHVKAYPFLDSDSIPIVKAILERNPDAKDSDKVLDYSESSLTQSIQRLMEKAHIETHGKVARFHNLRKYLIDRLSSVASESQWKQIIGKKIHESAYVSQDQLRDVYLRAMPSIVVNGNGKSSLKLQELETQLKELRDQNKTYRDIMKNLLEDKVSQESAQESGHKSGISKPNKWSKLLETLQ